MTNPQRDNKYFTYTPRLPKSSYFNKHYYLHLGLLSLVRGNPLNWSPSLEQHGVWGGEWCPEIESRSNSSLWIIWVNDPVPWIHSQWCFYSVKLSGRLEGFLKGQVVRGLDTWRKMKGMSLSRYKATKVSMIHSAGFTGKTRWYISKWFLF